MFNVNLCRDCVDIAKEIMEKAAAILSTAAAFLRNECYFLMSDDACAGDDKLTVSPVGKPCDCQRSNSARTAFKVC
jgi:hypothetical protein